MLCDRQGDERYLLCYVIDRVKYLFCCMIDRVTRGTWYVM